MATSKKKPSALDLPKTLTAIDLKNYNYYKSLTDKEKKAFSAFVMMRFISNSNGGRDIQEWFVEMTNESVNKNHWTVSKHADLMWKLCSTVGIGNTFFHQYLPALKPELDKFETLLAELNPSYKTEDLKLLASMMDDSDRAELLDKMGFDKQQRKEYE